MEAVKRRAKLRYDKEIITLKERFGDHFSPKGFIKAYRSAGKKI
jgi:hypothetical protein